MSNPETPGVRYRTTATGRTVPDYRPLVEIEAGRLLMPASCTVRVDVTGEPGLASVNFDVELVDRRYLTTRLEAKPPAGAGLDIEALRRLNIPMFIRQGVEHLVVFESVDGAQYTAQRPMEDPDPLWPVALTYSVAYALGESPTKAVQEHLGISHSAAAQRVKRAREAGYLPKTSRGAAS